MTKQRGRSTITLIAVCFGLFMIQLDLTVVNVALKSIQDNLHAGVTTLQWVVDAWADENLDILGRKWCSVDA